MISVNSRRPGRVQQCGLGVLALVALGACTTSQCEKTAPYETARQGGPLSVPEDLTAPRSSGKFDIPNAGQLGNVRGPCGDVPPLAPVKVAVADADVDDGPLPTLDGDVGGTPNTADSDLAPVAVSAGIERDIRESVIAWLTAWRRGDGEAAARFYSTSFEPPGDGETRDEWVGRRVSLLTASGEVDVRYDLLRVTETFAGARARFIQEFHTGGKIDAVVKILEFQIEDGRWYIVREQVVEVL